MPDAFDIDSEVEGLQGQIGRLKQVISAASVNITHMDRVQLAVESGPCLEPFAVERTQGKNALLADCNTACFVQVARAIGEENVLQSQAANSLVSAGIIAHSSTTCSSFRVQV